MSIEELARLYAWLTPQHRNKVRWWMSRATALRLHEHTTGLNSFTAMLTEYGIQLFGIPVMIDDRMSLNKVTLDMNYGTADISGDGGE